MEHRLIAHGLISDGEKYLVIKRSKIKRGKPNFYPEYWDIPGGTVEVGELPQLAAIREIKEEVNLEAKIVSIIHEDSNVDDKKQSVFTRLVYRCNVVNLDDALIELDPEEHSEYRWISELDELKDDKVVDYLFEIM